MLNVPRRLKPGGVAVPPNVDRKRGAIHESPVTLQTARYVPQEGLPALATELLGCR